MEKKISACWETVKIGSIVGITRDSEFEVIAISEPTNIVERYPMDCSLEKQTFVYRDFTVREVSDY
jgi:hypothetical protein